MLIVGDMVFLDQFWMRTSKIQKRMSPISLKLLDEIILARSDFTCPFILKCFSCFQNHSDWCIRFVTIDYDFVLDSITTVEWRT